jgi:hypothetical protein
MHVDIPRLWLGDRDRTARALRGYEWMEITGNSTCRVAGRHSSSWYPDDSRVWSAAENEGGNLSSAPRVSIYPHSHRRIEEIARYEVWAIAVMSRRDLVKPLSD